METRKAYEEIIDFIAADTTTERVAVFQASLETKARVADLIKREKTVGITSEEAAELKDYLLLEHLMRLAKIRARSILRAQ